MNMYSIAITEKKVEEEKWKSGLLVNDQIDLYLSKKRAFFYRLKIPIVINHATLWPLLDHYLSLSTSFEPQQLSINGQPFQPMTIIAFVYTWTRHKNNPSDKMLVELLGNFLSPLIWHSTYANHTRTRIN